MPVKKDCRNHILQYFLCLILAFTNLLGFTQPYAKIIKYSGTSLPIIVSTWDDYKDPLGTGIERIEWTKIKIKLNDPRTIVGGDPVNATGWELWVSMGNLSSFDGNLPLSSSTIKIKLTKPTGFTGFCEPEWIPLLNTPTLIMSDTDPTLVEWELLISYKCGVGGFLNIPWDTYTNSIAFFLCSTPY